MSRSDHDTARPKQQTLRFSESSRERLLLRARRALLTHALKFGTVTADDVRQLVPLPPGIDPRAFGIVPVSFAKAGIVQFHGYRKTSRTKGHGRDIKVWRLNDRDAAKRWLIEHPDVDDSTPPSTTSEG